MTQQKTKTEPVIADYDAVKYDYRTYWQGREYEDLADKIALMKLLQKASKKVDLKKDGIYIDIGGSYGREIHTYLPYAKHIILFDYSLETLKKGRKELIEAGITNVTYVAGNVYFLPFCDDKIDAGQMVRVMHHLKFTQKAFEEINRVINSYFILEAANKIHAKYAMKAILHGKMKDLKDASPYKQVPRETAQGSKGADQIFLNFHPTYISNEITKTDFHISAKLSVSNFRMPFLKKLVGTSVLSAVEKNVQEVLAPISFGPSMYYLLEKDEKVVKNVSNIDEIFCCPACRGKLEKTNNMLSCVSCKRHYEITDGVYDFRYTADNF